MALDFFEGNIAKNMYISLEDNFQYCSDRMSDVYKGLPNTISW